MTRFKKVLVAQAATVVLVVVAGVQVLRLPAFGGQAQGAARAAGA